MVFSAYIKGRQEWSREFSKKFIATIYIKHDGGLDHKKWGWDDGGLDHQKWGWEKC